MVDVDARAARAWRRTEGPCTVIKSGSKGISVWTKNIGSNEGISVSRRWVIMLVALTRHRTGGRRNWSGAVKRDSRAHPMIK